MAQTSLKISPALALLVVLLFQPLSFARTLYVTENGSETAGEPDDPEAPYSIRAAFEEAQNGDEILISDGHYSVTPKFPNDPWPQPDFAELQLQNLTNITIKGTGEVDIYGEGPGNFMMLEFCSDIHIENLTFRGDRPEVPEDSDEFPLFAMVHLRGTNSALTFSGCKFLQFGNHGISQILPPHVAYDVTVTNCYFLEGGDGYLAHRNGDPDGAALSGMGPGWMVVSNTVERCFTGFEIEGSWGSPIHDITIRGNFFTNNYCKAIVLYGTGTDYREYYNIKILNNQIAGMAPHPETPNQYQASGSVQG